MSMFKSIKLVSLIILGFVIFSGLAFYFLWQGKKPIIEQKQGNQTILDKQWQFSITKDVVSRLKQYNYVTYNTPQSDYLLWKKDGYLVYLPTADSISATYCGLSKGISNGDTKTIFNSTPLGSISKEIATVFDNQGFSHNDTNSTKLGEYYFIQSYDKNNMVCSANLSGDISTCGPNNQDNRVSMDIKCANDFDKLFAEQKPYIDLLISLNVFKDKNVAISDVKQEDGFLRIGETDGTEGALFILKQEKGGYILIDGPLQEDPQCKKMNEWNVPREIYGNCYDVNKPFGSDINL